MPTEGNRVEGIQPETCPSILQVEQLVYCPCMVGKQVSLQIADIVATSGYQVSIGHMQGRERTCATQVAAHIEVGAH